MVVTSLFTGRACSGGVPNASLVRTELRVSTSAEEEEEVVIFHCLRNNDTTRARCSGDDGRWQPDPLQFCGQLETTPPPPQPSTEPDTSSNRSCSPVPPTNGRIVEHASSSEGANVSFQCAEGYSPPPLVTATCENGRWKPIDPQNYSCKQFLACASGQNYATFL